jgi:hypothetical protein
MKAKERRLSIEEYLGALACALFMVASVLTFAEEDRPSSEEVVQDAANFMLQDLYQGSSPAVDDSRFWMDPEQRPSRDTTIYYQYMIPGYGTQRNDAVMETLEGVTGAPEKCTGLEGEAFQQCYEENAPTPAELERLSQDHNQQLREGTNPESQALQTVEEANREQPRYQFWNPEDGYHDPILLLAQDKDELAESAYQTMIGDCDRVDVPIYDIEHVLLSDPRTCNQIYAPDPGIHQCEASRLFQASQGEQQVLATLTPLADYEYCTDQAVIAVSACQTDKCADAADVHYDRCVIEEGCDDMDEGSGEMCRAGCQDQSETFELQCRDVGNGCEALEDETYSLCTAQCTVVDTICIIQCTNQGVSARTACDQDCNEAGENAFDQCIDDMGSAYFSGTLVFEIPMIGDPGTKTITADDGTEVLLEMTPFAGPIDLHDPDRFVANHYVDVIGGSGNVTLYGGPENGFVATAQVTGSAIEQAEIIGSLYWVEQNEIDGCEEYLDLIADNFCTGGLICTGSNPMCFPMAPGVNACEVGPSRTLLSVLKPWHSLSPYALELASNGEIFLQELAPRQCSDVVSEPMLCDYYLGAGDPELNCYIGADGIERCIEGTGEGLEELLGPEPYLDNCRHLHEDGRCNIESGNTCAEGGEGLVTGRCYVPDVIYECGEKVVIEKETALRREISCEGGEVQCVGSECLLFSQQSSSMDEVIVATSVLREMDRDQGCIQERDGEDPHELGEDCIPNFFEGEPMECKIPVGSNVGVTPDCCKEGRDAAEGEGFTNYMDAMTAAYHSGTAPGESGEQAQTGGKQDHSGAHLNTPSWVELQEDTEYHPPGSSGSSEGMSGGEGLASAPRQDHPMGTAASYYLDPDELDLADESAGNYASRRYTTPFEISAAQAGFVPRTQDQLALAKGAATGQGDMTFDRAVGLGAKGVLPEELYDQLYMEDGTPRWRRTRNGTLIQTQPSTMLKKGLQRKFGDAVPQGMAMRADGTDTAFSIAKMTSIAYSSYSLTKAIGHMVFSCEEDEIELGYAREARRCSYVGKYCNRRLRLGFIRVCIESREVYCCFNSAFSRIMVEQMRGLDDDPYGDFGTPREPNCHGYTVEEIANAELEEMDLSEWLVMEHMAGRYPGHSQEGGTGDGEAGGMGDSGFASNNVPIRISSREALQHYISPRRGIPGSGMEAAGPDGMIAVEDRISERIHRNIHSMEAARERLRQAGTERFDPELMPWYAHTTMDGPTRWNEDLQLPGNLGGDDSEKLLHACQMERPPIGGYTPITEGLWGEPLDEMIVTSKGDSLWASMVLSEYSYVAIKSERPMDKSPEVLWVMFMAQQPDVLQAQFEVTFSVCPGDFSDHIGPGCRAWRNASNLPWNLWVGISDDMWASGRRMCHDIQKGQPFYINIRMGGNLSEECVGATNDSIECSNIVNVRWSE